jgi:hypothetical protein
MYQIHQIFDIPHAIDLTEAVSSEWERLNGKLAIRPGQERYHENTRHRYLPKLTLDKIYLLIVDEMG